MNRQPGQCQRGEDSGSCIRISTKATFGVLSAENTYKAAGDRAKPRRRAVEVGFCFAGKKRGALHPMHNLDVTV
jgi:hypothetical protein